MQVLVKCITGIGVALFMKVMLVGSQGLLALPFHILNEATKPSFDLHFALCGLVDITDCVCHQPVTRLMDISLNVCRCAGRIPVVFAILLGGELRSLAGQKQWDGREIDVLLLRE